MATIRLNPTRLALMRELHELVEDQHLARKIGVSKASVSRVLAGKDTPSPRFIAGAMNGFGAKFEVLFDVVDDEVLAQPSNASS